MENTPKTSANEKHWNSFLQTGSISSYLMYKGISSAGESKDTNTEKSRGKSLGTY